MDRLPIELTDQKIAPRIYYCSVARIAILNKLILLIVQFAIMYILFT